MKIAPTKLPGGARLVLHTHLPSKICVGCGLMCQAADYLKSWRINSHGAHELRFEKSKKCLRCVPPERPFPASLRGARFRDDYVNAIGAIVGWRQRDRKYGTVEYFGDELSLTTLTLRRLASGVFAPQPKLVRVKGQLRPSHQRRVARDAQRLGSKRQLADAVTRQRGRCALCTVEFTATTPPTWDHIKPWSDGWSSVDENGQALCRRCNSAKGRRSMEDARRRVTPPPSLYE